MHYIKRHEANTLCDEDEKRHEDPEGEGKSDEVEPKEG